MSGWDEFIKKYQLGMTEPRKLVVDSIPVLKKHNVRTVLDHGCGAGRHTVFLAQQGFDVTGVDISEEAVKRTKALLEKTGLEARIDAGDMRSLVYPDSSFDAVVSVGVILHGLHADIEKTISEIERVLKPKGILVATMISHKDPKISEGREIAPNVYVGIHGPESEEPHYVCDEGILDRFFKNFDYLMKRYGEGSKGDKKVFGMQKRYPWELIIQKK
ncbi:MAG: class I SAM-dependent methyltransferase [Candidatus Diapherotrites archaeon]|nr:class I SAM-dependent methyltransferase [Candidatus Diapherotrites archaeon]